jgi:hypothetical protein
MNSDIIGGIHAMARETDRAFRRAGVVGREVEHSGCVGYEYTLPTSNGPVVVRSYATPDPQVSGRLGKKIRKKLKKVVKSRAFKALVKVAKGVASVVPGGAAVVTAATIAEKAARAIKKAKEMKKSGEGSGMAVVGGALEQGAAANRGA